MIGCDKVVLFTLLALSLGPEHHEACNRHISPKLWSFNPASTDSNELSSDASQIINIGPEEQKTREGRALRRRNRNHQRRIQSEEPVAVNSIDDDSYYNSLEYEYYEDDEVLASSTDGGSRRQGQHASPSLPVAPVASSHTKQPVQPHHEIQSGHYDTYQQTQKPSPLPGFLKTLAACLPLSLVAAAIPLGFANFDGATTTVTLNPAPVTMTITMSITQMAMEDDMGGDEGGGDEGGDEGEGGRGDEGGSEDYVLLSGEEMIEDGNSFERRTHADKRGRPLSTTPVPPTTTRNLKAQPRLSAYIVRTIFTPWGVVPTLSSDFDMEPTWNNLTRTEEGDERHRDNYLFRVEPASELNENDVFTLPLANHLEGNWTFNDPNNSNLIVSQVGEGRNQAEIVRLQAQEVKDAVVVSEEVQHKDVPNLKVRSNLVLKGQTTSPKPEISSRLPRLDLKNWSWN
ncbi:hypothetical protein TCAL_16878 [Tigriopus californicus]|uniref:Uncharacterized protein n=2 Tax=Tigriopus californicus TaxID=6832 RepID=A0A553PBW6_TIGCA|nr:hypothetical protein TCAL_16878 [Tigriopus californicus]